MIVINAMEEITSTSCRIIYPPSGTPGPFYCYDKLIVYINYHFCFWSVYFDVQYKDQSR